MPTQHKVKTTRYFRDPGLAPSVAASRSGRHDPMKLYPLFADLAQRAVLVVGGGAVAARKVESLLAAGAQVTVGATALNAQLSQLFAGDRIRHRTGEFQDTWLDEFWLVIVATSDRQLNRSIAAAASARRIFANVVDDAALSSFQVPAIVDRSPLIVAISSGGSAPMLARQLRERLETLLDPALGALATLADRFRTHIRTHHPDLGTRRQFYERLFDGRILGLLRSGQPALAQAVLESALREKQTTRLGSVVLVGAGPGDPGLLTLKGLRALNQADVILYDRLVSSEVLALARRDAVGIEVGKAAGQHSTAQSQIHALLLKHARDGQRVVRLKGGDPFVFGRGGEELEFLRAHAIPYEVVPGITAAIACAAHAGVPLTHRDHAQSVRFVTAHCRASLDILDWSALAQERQTLAVYMGVGELDVLRDRLVAHGLAPTTPFALIENGSRPEQRVVTGTLAQLPERAIAHKVGSPALLIIGEVAALAEHLHWFGAAPLGDAVPPTGLLQAA